MVIATFACQPKPAESVFSILARIHIQTGEQSPFNTLTRWTGRRGYMPLSGLPTNLGTLAQKLSLEGGVDRLVSCHTHYRFYAHFLNEDRRRFLRVAMEQEGSPKSRLGVLASRVTAQESLRYCIGCLEEDIEHFGVAIWHSDHSMPGMQMCVKHQQELIEVSNNGVYGARNLFLPSAPDSVLVTQRYEDIHERLLFVSEQLKYLHDAPVGSPISVFVYRSLLYERGLITSNGHVRQKEVIRLVDDWLEPLSKVLIFQRMRRDLKAERSWVAELVAGGQSFHHPLKHIALWGAVQANVVDMFYAAGSIGEQLELNLEINRVSEITKEVLETAFDQYGTLTGVASFLRTTVTTISAYADIYGLNYRRRSKFITDEVRSSIREGYKEGKKSAELAAMNGISITSVNRIIRAQRTLGST